MGLFGGDQRRAWRLALEAEQARLRKQPGDVRALTRAGRLQEQLGLVPQAIRSYSSAADRYGEEGFWLKAAAVNKLAIALAPQEAELLEREAEFYARLGLLEQAATALERAVRVTEARWKRGANRPGLVEVDEDSPAGRVLLAEHHLAEGRKPQAMAELAKVAGPQRPSPTRDLLLSHLGLLQKRAR